MVFRQELYKALGKRLDFSTTFHSYSDGQPERTIQTLQGMLRICMMDFGDQWDIHLQLIDFAYNNSYYASIEMTLYKAHYRRKCISTMCWKISA